MKYKVTYRNDTTKIVDTNSIKDANDFFTVAYTKNGINQIIAVRASSEQEAKQKFMDYMKKKGRQVEFVGVTRGKEDKPGLPVIDTCVKDSRKLFTIMVNDKIYKVKAKDCDTAMKAVEDACVKDVRESYEVAGVRIYEDTRTGKVELNFAASGTVSIQQAEDLIKNMQSAINRAKTIENEYKTGKRKKE